jgi:hypothetical protein
MAAIVRQSRRKSVRCLFRHGKSHKIVYRARKIRQESLSPTVCKLTDVARHHVEAAAPSDAAAQSATQFKLAVTNALVNTPTDSSAGDASVPSTSTAIPDTGEYWAIPGNT